MKFPFIFCKILAEKCDIQFAQFLNNDIPLEGPKSRHPQPEPQNYNRKNALSTNTRKFTLALWTRLPLATPFTPPVPEIRGVWPTVCIFRSEGSQKCPKGSYSTFMNFSSRIFRDAPLPFRKGRGVASR